MLFAAYLRGRGLGFTATVKAALLFCWAPLGWMIYSSGISPGGTFVVEVPTSPERLLRYVYLGWITAKNTPIPVIVLALIGAIKLRLDARWKILLAFIGLFLLSIPFSAHGESPNPERFVTSREATLFIAAGTMLAGLGISVRPRIGLALASAGLLLGTYDAHRFIRRDTSQPRLQLSYHLAQRLDSRLGGGERAAILTAPIPRELVERYLAKVSNRAGEEGLRRASEILRSLDTSPPDYQRTVVHSRLGKQRLVSFASSVAPGSPEPQKMRVDWVAVWSDFQPGNAVEEQLYQSVRARPPVETLHAQSLSVSIYRATQ